jgi:hypothetical protein
VDDIIHGVCNLNDLNATESTTKEIANTEGVTKVNPHLTSTELDNFLSAYFAFKLVVFEATIENTLADVLDLIYENVFLNTLFPLLPCSVQLESIPVKIEAPKDRMTNIYRKS